MKTIYIGLGMVAIVMLFVCIWLFFFSDGKERPADPKDKPILEETEEKEVNKPVLSEYDPLLQEEIYRDLAEHNYGKLHDGIRVFEDAYLVLSKSRTQSYDEQYTGDHLLWVKRQKDESILQPLGTGKLVGLFTAKGSPIIKQGENYYFVFHERSALGQSGYMLKGYIYKIHADQSVELVYTTIGDFLSVNTTKNGILLKEKEYDDPYNQYPMHLKPYVVYSVEQNDSGEWKRKKLETVKPAEIGKFGQ